MKNLIVAKFGGTSMQDAVSMQAAAKIVLSNPDIALVVVSATAGTTNSLLKLAHLYGNLDLFHDHTTIEQECQLLTDRHVKIAEELKLDYLKRDIQELFLEAKVVGKTLTKGLVSESLNYKKQVDRLLSIGERTSSLIFATYLKSQNSHFDVFDVRKVLKTNANYNHAEPLLEDIPKEVYKELAEPLKLGKRFVTQGFIGSTINGNTTTLGRGGSDFSAALLGAAIDAKEIQIWTDVAGMFSMDPRIVPEAKLIETLSFAEASEMCNFGAKVLHPSTIYPALSKNIPVKILSTFEPTKSGTTIQNIVESVPTYRSVTLRKKQTLLLLSQTNKRLEHSTLSRVFRLFDEYHVPVDLINTSEVNLAITLDESMSEISLNPNFIAGLENICQVQTIKNLNLVGVIGNNLRFEKILNSVQKYNLKLINYGASSHNICFLVPENEAIAMVKTLHHDLIEVVS